MSEHEEEDPSMGDRLSNVAYDATEGVVDLVNGDGEGAVDHFLDMSRDALDVITDGGFSTYVERINDEHDLDLRETFKDGLEDAGEAIADGAHWVADTAEGVVDTVSDTVDGAVDAVDDAIDWAGDQLSELNPF